MVADYINTMRTTFLFKFWWLTSFFRITTSNQRETFVIDSFSLFSCLCVSILFKNVNQNWKRKSSSLYWYMRQRLYKKWRRGSNLIINFTDLEWCSTPNYSFNIRFRNSLLLQHITVLQSRINNDDLRMFWGPGSRN